MKTFTDNKGRVWDASVTVSTVKRVKTVLDVDLTQAAGGELLKRLIVDPVMLVDLIYVVCKPQADALGVTDEQFGEGLAGDAIDDATQALMEALIDFFPRALRKLAGKAWLKANEGVAILSARVEKEISSVDYKKIADEAFGKPSTSVPDASASTPDPSRSES